MLANCLFSAYIRIVEVSCIRKIEIANTGKKMHTNYALAEARTWKLSKGYREVMEHNSR